MEPLSDSAAASMKGRANVCCTVPDHDVLWVAIIILVFAVWGLWLGQSKSLLSGRSSQNESAPGLGGLDRPERA